QARAAGNNVEVSRPEPARHPVEVRQARLEPRDQVLVGGARLDLLDDAMTRSAAVWKPSDPFSVRVSSVDCSDWMISFGWSMASMLRCMASCEAWMTLRSVDFSFTSRA